jgi:hypothetical protein
MSDQPVPRNAPAPCTSEAGGARGYTARIWLHGGYMAPESKKANPEELA